MTIRVRIPAQRQYVLPVVREVSHGQQRRPPVRPDNGRTPVSQRDLVAASLLLRPPARG